MTQIGTSFLISRRSTSKICCAWVRLWWGRDLWIPWPPARKRPFFGHNIYIYIYMASNARAIRCTDTNRESKGSGHHFRSLKRRRRILRGCGGWICDVCRGVLRIEICVSKEVPENDNGWVSAWMCYGKSFIVHLFVRFRAISIEYSNLGRDVFFLFNFFQIYMNYFYMFLTYPHTVLSSSYKIVLYNVSSESFLSSGSQFCVFIPLCIDTILIAL